MIIEQVFTKGLAHSSYLLGGTTNCAIVDPRRDADIYISLAEEEGLNITHILETHLHADFISGHMDLVEKTGAQIYAPASANCDFEYVALSEGDEIHIDDMTLRIIETPGHTPEHISYIVTDTSRGSDPVGVFCGDTLFVGDVGRPDLFPGRAEELAGKLYSSLHDKLMKLPDFCEVYPAHGAGSLCGRAMASKRTSTIGYEKKYNYALNLDKESFIESLTKGMPDAPDHFSRCSEINRNGPAALSAYPDVESLNPKQFRELSLDSSTIVLDVRSFGAFGGEHIPGAFNIDLASNFSMWAGWLLPPDRDILLVADDYNQITEASVLLHRVGLDRIRGYLKGGMFAWSMAGFPCSHVTMLSAEELHSMSREAGEFVLVDVRDPTEYSSFHIETSINIHLPDLRSRCAELDPESPTVLICGSGQRSGMGASILMQHGFSDVYNVAGGMTGYNARGFGPECSMCALPWSSRLGK
ncbi:glyoxylase-like metal-dependent hydrolase (beta-lactamase superfamily II)/rhodanese-related sulfurtransferase [Methanohalophilus levihalophilus]|uniref:MBL fold metallo-hydrolase n=1 Tax=Methanohalophilus levihalophilus TaxID=1431282 RepID=UPI001AE232D6|nr:MBL fold metallo-hydrolase [Methanohalophilus levihalophilus]MBP2030145.1 glyoxylase-like metal-dependent hydrolase (beta-lactamase superfamily II)/rhodanese-related sulfurtransferase [Methanohalophilus levihalophilus]